MVTKKVNSGFKEAPCAIVPASALTHMQNQIYAAWLCRMLDSGIVRPVKIPGTEKEPLCHLSHLRGEIALVPSKVSTGNNVSKRRIARKGNSHLRRIIIKAASCYSKPLKLLKSEDASVPKAVRLKAEKRRRRLHKRRAALKKRGVNNNKVKIAIARELCEWIYHVAVMVA